MNEPLLIGGMAAVTFLIRYPALALTGKIEMPRPLFEALGYVPPAVLAAFVIPALLMPDDKTIQIGGNPGLIAGVVAALVMWRSRSLLLTILVGMGGYLLLRLVMAG